MRNKAEIRQACEAANIERVKLIGASAWFECASKVLTEEENQQVRVLWDTMPGNTCWMDAFFEWMKQ
jgi:hypothetical protein